MAKVKSELLSAYGTSFEIFKVIADEVINLGGGDEELRKILSDPELKKTLAEKIMAGTKNASTEDKLHRDGFNDLYPVVKAFHEVMVGWGVYEKFKKNNEGWEVLGVLIGKGVVDYLGNIAEDALLGKVPINMEMQLSAVETLEKIQLILVEFKTREGSDFILSDYVNSVKAALVSGSALALYKAVHRLSGYVAGLELFALKAHGLR